MVHDDEPVGLDGVRVEFDDERVVSDAGVMLVATLAQRLGSEALAQQLVRVGRGRPRGGNRGREGWGCWKQGAGYGYTGVLGYDPLLATRADTRETLHIRLRRGSANTQKGIKRFTDELIARVERAGATGVKLLRADSGFWNTK